MKKENFESVENKLKEDSNVEIKLQASTILRAYHSRANEKKQPAAKKKRFILILSLSMTAVAASVVVGVVFWPKNNSTPIYKVPVLNSSAKKLIFEANNLSGCLGFASEGKNKTRQMLDDDDVGESEESDDETLVLTKDDYYHLASTYHLLFSILNKSSDSSGSFAQSGNSYVYNSGIYGSSLTLTEDPANLPSSFDASISKGPTSYSLSGSYQDELLSFTVAEGSSAHAIYKEEINALRQNRRKFSYSETSPSSSRSVYFDADFEDGTELDVEMGQDLYENGVLTESLEFDSSFESSGSEIEASLTRGEQEIEDIVITTKVGSASTEYSFPGADYFFEIANI